MSETMTEFVIDLRGMLNPRTPIKIFMPNGSVSTAFLKATEIDDDVPGKNAKHERGPDGRLYYTQHHQLAEYGDVHLHFKVTDREPREPAPYED